MQDVGATIPRYTLPADATWQRIATPAPAKSTGANNYWIRVDTRNGKQILAGVWTPSTSGPHPVIVFFHGTAGLIEGEYMWASTLAQHGYIVVAGCWWGGRPSVLESEFPASRYEGQLVICPNGPEFSGANTESVQDVLPLIRAATLQPAADPTRVAVAGNSRGGTLAMLVASLTSDIDAVISMVGAYVSPQLGWFNIAPGELQPGLVAGGLQAPALIIAASEDERVPYVSPQKFAERLRTLGKTVETQFLEGAPHGVHWITPWRERTQTAAKDFLNKYLR